jgi:FkbM family methyltransferase
MTEASGLPPANKYIQFSSDLGRALIENVYNVYEADNWDPFRFGPRRLHLKRRVFELLARPVNRLLGPAGMKVVRTRGAGDDYESFMHRYGEGLADLHALLADKYSKDLLVQVMAYRLLGYERVKLPTSPAFLEYYRQAQTLVTRNDCIDIQFQGWKLAQFDLSTLGYPLSVYSIPVSVASTFIHRDYAYDRVTPPIGPAAGDYVIDGGAAWGDTAVFFAWAVGASGRVFSFEFEPTSLGVIRRNLDLNPDLDKRVEIVPRALWNQSDVPLSFASNGPATHVSDSGAGSSDRTVTTMAIDDFCKDLPRVDFIKMDIEGAELQALQGAVATIEKHKPKLAISLYHSLDDFVRIPRFLSGLNVDYRYYLGHFSIHLEETVLFAAPQG